MAVVSWLCVALRAANVLPSKGLTWPPQARLKSGGEFDTVFRTKNRYSGSLVRLFCVRRPESPTRFGLAVGKKIAKAHERTRGRRVLREALRRLYPYCASGYWIVVVMTPRGLNSSSRELYHDLSRVLGQAKLLNSQPPAQFE